MTRILTLGLLLCIPSLLHGAPDGGEARQLTLEEALAVALERNPDVAEAQTRLDEARARVTMARAGARPTLKARGLYDYATEDQRLFPATRDGDPGVFGAQTFGAELVASLPLYTGGRVTGESAAADLTHQAFAEQLARTREMLAYQVTAFYYGLLAQDEVLRSLQTAVDAMDEQQRTIQALVDAQKAARVDLLRANVRRAELYERQVRERSNRTTQQRAWAALLGLDDAVAPVARGALALRETVPCPAAGECMQRALIQRTDYRAAQSMVSAEDAGVRAARSGYRPTVSAQASYGWRWLADGTDSASGADEQADVGRVGLVVELPLFEGGLTDARVADRQARLRGSRERLRKLELQIRFEVETALADIAAAQERIGTADQAVGQAEESFRIMKEKYDLGKGTMTDVLDAQTALVTTETSRARALADLAVAEARRELAVGEILP